ncbi:hypothetical protein [Micromonospora aurantiaca (nom. illeg.)]|uniref:hypothetical protein n=1 Tax=Micromonospora aurantiaca (nom. illeg.) TaxID=47850 RepID=UPI003EB6B008
MAATRPSAVDRAAAALARLRHARLLHSAGRTFAGETRIWGTPGPPLPRRRFTGTYTSIMPFRAGGRRLFLAVLADPESPDLGRGLAGAGAAVAADEPRLVLAVASAVGRWRPFGEVRLDDERGAAEDAALAFDPIGNVPPGLRLAGPLARLRDDSYRGSRRARGAGLSRAARRG